MANFQEQQIIDLARHLCGTPYRHQGRDPGTGLDCLGLIIVIAQSIGFNTRLDRQNYPRFPDGLELRETLLAAGLIETGQAEAGGLVQICFRGLKGWGQHLGIVSDRETIIHAYERNGQGKVKEEPLKVWQRGTLGKITAFYKFPICTAKRAL